MKRQGLIGKGLAALMLFGAVASAAWAGERVTHRLHLTAAEAEATYHPQLACQVATVDA